MRLFWWYYSLKSNFKQCISHFREVFETVRKYNSTLKPEKCLFFQEEVELLRHMVSPTGIKPTAKLLQKISLFEPKSKTDIKVCGCNANVTGNIF